MIAELFRCRRYQPERTDSSGKAERIRRDEYGMGSYVIAFEEEAGSVKDVELTEADIDSFIRAKGRYFLSHPYDAYPTVILISA